MNLQKRETLNIYIITFPFKLYKAIDLLFNNN